MKRVLQGAVVVAAIVLAGAFGGTAVAAAGSPSSTISVQDGGSGADGAAVDTDGTQGSYKTAMDGSESGPVMVATPQDKASH
ncbi:MAG TPA: hypothetical protein PLI79_12840 [Mycobacterium sp.]|nr:hypothetical protein [Mycobacterium sp.]HNM09878.1 hypothetical protein [Mycobacterium sp.]HNM92601.1 hypothetical protein [Mycobacterium sp.]HNP14372.1 hypothetical protein [Mycobacterium sp.]HRD12740.1 hypothetical protein [Mycobacterium sp.]